MMASKNGHGEVVGRLLTKGASMDVQNKAGSTALMRASYNGHGEVVDMLLAKGANCLPRMDLRLPRPEAASRQPEVHPRQAIGCQL